MMLLKTFLLFCLAIGYTTAETRVKRQSYPPNQAPYRQSQGYQQPQGYQQQQQQPYAQQQPQQYAQQQAQRPPRQQYGGAPAEEEKEQGPHPLTLLLENSKFECGGKSDGYYADSGVGCQAFHYCVSGQKHSMMCPAGTVFHQVHLNCVPQDQDICNKADKFFFVNDYLNKAVEKGPNNTVVYANRYYPENYANGDPFIPPSEATNKPQQPPAATYGLGPAYREQQPAQQSYRPPSNHIQHQQAPAQHAAYQQAAAHRPQNPAPYSPPVPSQAYQQRPAHQPAVAVQAPARPAQPQSQLYGYGAQQAYNAQQEQAQRAYAQQQYQALAPQQNLYGAGAGQRPRFAQQY